MTRGIIRSDTDGYQQNHICFHILVRIRIQIWIASDTNTNTDIYGYKYI
jgi:hypothetical protein